MTADIPLQTSIGQGWRWSRENLFDSRGNSLLTIASLAIAGALAFVVFKFVLVDANWGLVAINRKLFLVGSYPADEAARLWIAIFVGAALVSLTYGLWVRRLRPYLVPIGIVAVIILTFGLGVEFRIEEMAFSESIESAGQTTVVSGIDRQLVQSGGWAPSWLYAFSLGMAVPFGGPWLLVAAVFAVLAGGAVLGRRLARYRESPIVRQGFGAAWVLLIPLVVVLQIGVSTNHWESVLLDILVFTVGGFFSFVIGLLLALGRISPFRAIRISAVGYIETVRAAPLLVWLLFATFLQDELGPIGLAFSSIDLVFRVMFVFAFFGGAYIAEVVRGGLQSIPRGQFEAADAIGLNPIQKYAFIILPQAIKAVIPAIIGRFIALWKDTALLAAISLVNTLEKAKKVLAGQADIAEGAFFEVYLIVALIYWIVSYLLSRLGSAAEARLGESTH